MTQKKQQDQPALPMKPRLEPRLGPRPLPLYLALAHMQWLSWPAALASLNSASMNLSAGQELPEWLQARMAQESPALVAERRRLWSILQKQKRRDPLAEKKFEQRLEALARQHYSDFLTGLTRYRNASVCRDVAPPPVLWQQGTTRLLDFGQGASTGKKRKIKTRAAAAENAPVLIIPSLVNRYHVLDLDAQQSFVRSLTARGFRPLLVDWGEPGEEERRFTLDAYMQERLLPILRFVHAQEKQAVHLIGYCMGGLFATALAFHAQAHIRSLMCMATPWDFHVPNKSLSNRVAILLQSINPYLDSWGALPVDVLQSFFIGLQPFPVLDKFTRFASVQEGSVAERNFVLTEDWVNEGVPLVKQVTRECLSGWYVENVTQKGRWHVLGGAVRPATLRLPNLHVIPKQDKIVPPESALALAGIMPQAALIRSDFGHVSMMVHAAARDKLWPDIFDWLAQQQGCH